MKSSLRKIVLGFALAGSLGACSSVTSQREVNFDNGLANRLNGSPVYSLGAKSVVFDYNDSVPYKSGSAVSVDVNSLVGRPAIIHSDKEKRDLGVTVQVEDVNLGETYRISCPVEYDEKTKLVNPLTWGTCAESITKPSDGGASDSGGPGDGGAGGGGESTGGA